ncbi:hypothetical protein J4410_04930 [Candidatus Woesearchaeota archaeon]|nr:hypothetical protein [Candidatus Woesearchaeota archaeon]
MTLTHLVLDQTKGIFKGPEEVKRRYATKSWLKRIRPCFQHVPLVVQDAPYYLRGVLAKLHADQSFVFLRELLSYSLLRPLSSDQFHPEKPEPVHTLSLAQTISFLFDEPLESILYTSDQLKEVTAQRTPEEQVNMLTRAYQGVKWFERLKRKHRDLSVSLPPVPLSRAISRTEIVKWLDISEPLFQRLCETGLLVPSQRRPFVPKSSRNTLDPHGLAQLVSFLYDREIPFAQETEHEQYKRDIAHHFTWERVLPYLVERKLDPFQQYSLSEASAKTGFSYDPLYQAWYSRALPRSSRACNVNGLALALYALKSTRKSSFTKEDLVDLFGKKDIDPSKLGFRRSKKGTYSRIHYVFPFYEYLTKHVRETFQSFPPMDWEAGVPIIQDQEGKWYLSKTAQKQYCSQYGLDAVDTDCLEHLCAEMRNKTLSESTITTPVLAMKREGRIIKEIHIRLTGVRNSLSLDDP